MAIYHLSVKILSKSGGKSAISAAAYRSGSKLLDRVRNQTYNYTQKSDVEFCEILLPENAPQEFSDRETLWNNVEQIEKKANAQLAREIEFALPVELEFEEQKTLAHNFALTFVKAGMCVDLAFHNKKGNPHCHLLLTMRSIGENGKWLPKCKSSYSLDADGNKIPVLDKNGNQLKENSRRKWKKITIPTNDWNNRDKVEEWRANLSEMINLTLEEAGKIERVDHRSFKRQGIKLIPTIHLGQKANAMEKMGIKTVRGDQNRAITQKNISHIQSNKCGNIFKSTINSLFKSNDATGGGLQGFLRTDISELIKRLVKNGKSDQEIEEILEEIEAGNYIAASGTIFAMQKAVRHQEEKEREEDERRKQERKQRKAAELSEQERQKIIAGIARSKRDIERFKRAINNATPRPAKGVDEIREPQSLYKTVANHDLQPTERNYVAELFAYRREETEREITRISKEREEAERRERELANKSKSAESGTGTIKTATPTEESIHIKPRGITRQTEQTTAKNKRGFSR